MLMSNLSENIEENKIVDYLSISLCISSDRVDPESITRHLGIRPTRVRLRGTPTLTGIMRRPEFDLNEWESRKELRLASSVLVPKEAEQFIGEFLSEFRGVVAEVHTLSEEHDVLVALVYHMKSIPYIGLTRDQVKAVAALGARVDYDILVDTQPILS